MIGWLNIIRPFPASVVMHPKKRLARCAFRSTAVAYPVDQWVLTNGIFGSESGWQYQAANWINANTSSEATAYYHLEGLFKWWQSQHVAALASILQTARAAANGGRVSLISHSNGCQISRMALQSLPAGVVDDFFAIAAADQCDCGDKGNGFNSLLSSGRIKRIFLAVSKGDDILKWNWLTPSFWGCQLGCNGPSGAAFNVPYVPFATLPVSPSASIVVGEDDTEGHLDWLDKPAPFNLDTIKTIISVPATQGAIK